METQEKLLLRGVEVARALNISRALAYRWMAAGILPVVRVPGGRSVRVPQLALLKWIETNTAGAGEGERISDPIAPGTDGGQRAALPTAEHGSDNPGPTSRDRRKRTAARRGK
jgi:excisionase family DNA binding protein